MLSPPTRKQRQVFRFLVAYREKHGVMPSQREIRDHFGFKSLFTVQEHLRLMEKKGLIRRRKGAFRAIQIVEPGKRAATYIPRVDHAPAGKPSPSLDNSRESLPFPAGLFRGLDLFAIRVKDNSMAGAGVYNGDLAVLSVKRGWRDGSVAAVVVNERTLLTRAARAPGGLRLRKEKASGPEPWRRVSVNDGTCRVAGILVGTIRQFS